MKAGRSLPELAAEIRRQAESKRDFLADTRELTLLNGNELSVGAQGEFQVRDLGHAQIAEHLSIPRSCAWMGDCADRRRRGPGRLGGPSRF